MHRESFWFHVQLHPFFHKLILYSSLSLFLSVHRVGQSVILITVIHSHGHGRFLGNLAHFLCLLVQIVPSSQQGQHQQHHNGGQHTDDGVQFLAFSLHLRGCLSVPGIIVSTSIHSLAGHHSITVVRDRIDGANGGA